MGAVAVASYRLVRFIRRDIVHGTPNQRRILGRWFGGLGLWGLGYVSIITGLVALWFWRWNWLWLAAGLILAAGGVALAIVGNRIGKRAEVAADALLDEPSSEASRPDSRGGVA